MKAAILYGPNDLRVEDVPMPKCLDKGALIKLSGSMICGSDLKIYKNSHPAINLPQIIGHEACGEIIEVGDSDDDCKIGDRVTIQSSIACGKCRNCLRGYFNICENLLAFSLNYPGLFAEYVAIPEQAIKMGNLIKVPESLSDEEGCLAEPMACVINGQEPLAIQPGEEVLVVGAGPIGLLHAELARMRGASRIIIAQRSAGRLEMAKQFGYSDYINSEENDLVKEVRRITNDRGVDVAIVTAPAREPMEQAVELLDFRGRLSLFGSLIKGNSIISIDSRPIHYKELKVIGASSSGVVHMKKALSILETGRINTKELITHRLPLEHIVEGMTLAAEGKALKIYLNHGLS